MVEQYVGELAKLENEKRTTTGLGGKSRRLGPRSHKELAQDAVRKALKRAYTGMKNANPPLTKLGLHLDQSIQRKGDGYAYCPADPPDWQLT